MEAASLTLPARRDGLMASLRDRRRSRRAARLRADAERFDRAAAKLESSLERDAWQVSHLRRQAAQLRELAQIEQAA
jgi:predicted RNase H-like nuclease (RuvC/YqgF family)